MSATRARRGHLLGSSVLVVIALACGWPQWADGGAGKRTIRPRVGAVGRPQRPTVDAARRQVQRRPGIELAAALRRRALDVEPEVTTALRATLEREGGTLVDLDQRIKPSGSLLHYLYRRFREADGDEARALERRIFDITGAVPIPRGVGQRAGMTRSNEVMTPR